MKNTGWYNRDSSTEGVILPQGITEFANSGGLCDYSSNSISERSISFVISFISPISYIIIKNLETFKYILSIIADSGNFFNLP